MLPLVSSFAVVTRSFLISELYLSVTLFPYTYYISTIALTSHHKCSRHGICMSLKGKQAEVLSCSEIQCIPLKQTQWPVGWHGLGKQSLFTLNVTWHTNTTWAAWLLKCLIINKAVNVISTVPWRVRIMYSLDWRVTRSPQAKTS
jgi:hypothetical protein